MFDLPEDHPGFSDEAYRRRRSEIAAVAAAYEQGAPIPHVRYTSEEDDLWRLVSTELRAMHERFACAEYLEAASRLRLPADAVPQLSQVTAALQPLTGWRVEPVPGLVPIREFYGSLARRRFCSTQYVRHHSVPFYTPEPDIVHEIIGHANSLASPAFAGLYELAGQASLRAHTDAELERFSKVFWFTIEFGVVREEGELRPTAPASCRRSGRWMRSAAPRSVRGTSSRWRRRPTTSRPISRCCSPRRRSPRWWSASPSSSNRSDRRTAFSLAACQQVRNRESCSSGRFGSGCPSRSQRR